MTQKNLFGVIDIGSLKVKLLVAGLDSQNRLQTEYQSNTLTCLGVRMNENNNRPKPAHFAQTIKELKRCQRILAGKKVKKIRVVSTHALREMGKVGQEIAQKIKDKAGFQVEIISQREEAELFFQAVTRDFKTKDDLTVLDVGGGSVQVLVGNKKKLKQVHLLKTGAQYLFDTYSPRHSGTDAPTRAEIREMKKYILEQLTPLPRNVKAPVVYGSSCIIDLFQTIGLKLDRYQFSKSHPYKTEVRQLKTFLKKIIPIPYDEREKTYRFKQKYYMWGIDKAFLNVCSICEKTASPFVIPSNANINQGLVLSLAK
jgi:exopolyphosphatase/guanosine-5'-triphosphate,3'-diphosphate pyrophosphatase